MNILTTTLQNSNPQNNNFRELSGSLIREQSVLEQRHSTVVGQSGRKVGNQGISESGGNGMYNMMRDLTFQDNGVNLGSIGEE